MLLSPKNRKFRKDRKGNKGKVASITYTGCFLDKGEYGLKVMEPGKVTAAQLDAMRIVVKRTMKKEGKLFFRVFPHKPITKKAAETRMGSGKGNPEFWVSPVEPGRILFEIDGVSEDVAKAAVRLAQFKLPMATKFVRRIL